MPWWGWLLAWAAATVYATPVMPTWCFVYAGSRPRRGRFRSWAWASTAAVLWLPAFAWLLVGLALAAPDVAARKARTAADHSRVDELEGELRRLNL